MGSDSGGLGRECLSFGKNVINLLPEGKLWLIKDACKFFATPSFTNLDQERMNGTSNII